jgi:beta-lactamase class D
LKQIDNMPRESAINAAMLLVFGATLSIPAAGAQPTCTAIADAASGKVLKQEGVCDRRVTPASTFKIALSLMAFDSGYLIDEHHPALPFEKGYPDFIESWKTTTDPASWMKNSVVWYSWQITGRLGKERFKDYVIAFNYGNEDVSGNPGKHDGLTRAWLTSSLKISPLEQLDFLRRLLGRELPVNARAYEMTSRITAIGVLGNGWQVHGKTGTGSRVAEDGSIDPTRQVGWFVGWASRGDRTLVFARCMEDVARAPPNLLGPRMREQFLKELPSLLDSL